MGLHVPARLARPAGVDLCDISFGYAPDHAPVLRGVTFSIPPGAMVALVGANGAGMSTIVKLLCRLYEPTSGQIRRDGRDVAGIDVLLQDFMRYDLTFADTVVDRLPHEYDTMLSRVFGGTDEADGVQLSGGPWQRVALARSLLSAVRHADAIVVLAAGGEYARLYRRQAHGFGRPADAAAG